MRIWRISCPIALVAVAFVLLTSPRASAGPYGDTLGKCLVEATTAAEKATLVRWMFATMALHPDVQSISAVTPEQRTGLTKQTAELFQRLLTETCRTQAREAVRYEGASTLQSSFSLLGQVAVRELFANPKVAAGLAELSKYVDEKKLKELAAPTTPQ
jgi:hypothetical protein